MTRERAGRAVVRLYPRAMRISRGEEMLGTLLDAGDDSAIVFARESASLGLGGVRERARATAQIATSRLVADAFRQAALIWMAISLAGISADAFADPRGLHGLAGGLLLLWPILALSLLGYDRLAGVCGVTWIAGLQLPIASGPYPPILAGALVPLVGFVVMITAPRVRPHDPRRLALLAPTIVTSLILQPSVLGVGTLGIVSLVVCSVAGLLVLAADPRLAIASALAWASIGLMSAEPAAMSHRPTSPAMLLIATAPVMILIVTARLRVIRSRAE